MTALCPTIRDAVTVTCPAANAHRFLMSHFGDGANPATVHLLVPVGDLALDREVDVRLSDLPSNPLEYVMQVGWSAAGGGPYPTFVGSLACLPADAMTTHIELEGTYTIPGGFAGKVFDATFGHRIGVAASRSMLIAMQAVVEAAYANEPRTAVIGPHAAPATYE